MTVKVYDNFLSKESHEHLCKVMILNQEFSMYFHDNVINTIDEKFNFYWNWYATHTFYLDDRPVSDHYDVLKNILGNKVMEVTNTKTFTRIRLNFYPYTETLKEHSRHIDKDYSHTAGIYCLNTCDGFTRFEDGSIVESVANRFYTFDGSQQHNSSTTTNSKGRYNINFNLV